MTSPYVVRDECELPALISGEGILPAGTQFSCPHFLWTVGLIQFQGWASSQPAWTSSPLPADALPAGGV